MAAKAEKGQAVGKCTACKGKVIVEIFPTTTYHCGSCGLMYRFPPPQVKKAKNKRVKQLVPVASDRKCVLCGGVMPCLNHTAPVSIPDMMIYGGNWEES